MCHIRIYIYQLAKYAQTNQTNTEMKKKKTEKKQIVK